MAKGMKGKQLGKLGKLGKRGAGEGSIRRRSDGRWEARLTLDDGSRKSFYGASRTEVREKLTAAQRDRDTGLPVIADERLTLGAFVTTWLEAKTPPTVEPSTHKRYTELLTLHVVPTLGSVPLTRVTPAQVQALYARLQREGLSPTTVRKTHMVLHAVLRTAVRMGVATRNVTELVDAPRNAASEIHPLSRAQVQALLDAAADDRIAPLLMLAVSTGMRQGELLGLHWRDVDLDDGSLQVRQVQQRQKGVLIYKRPKTAKSRRRIALAPTAVAALRAHSARLAQVRLRLGAAWAEGVAAAHRDLVFPNAIGRPYPAESLVLDFRRVLKKADLPSVRFHDLRHTAATLLLGARVNPKVVSEMLGHSTVAITLDIYSHVLPDMQQDAAAVMERLIAATG